MLKILAVVGVTVAVMAAPAFAEGDPQAGFGVYMRCQICHGPSAMGQETMGAPKLVGQDGWYMARQLRNFRDGVRGTNPADQFGVKMQTMSRTLTDEMIDDVVAYIATLEE